MVEEVTIRRPTSEDVEQMFSMSHNYYIESFFFPRLKMCVQTTYETLITAVNQGISMVAEANGVLIGMVLCSATRSIFKSPDLGVDVFYVAPEFRGTKLSNMFQDGIQSMIEKEGFATAYAASTSGFGQKVEKQYTNMLKKRGYEVTGPCCVFINKHCEEAA